MMSLKKKKSLVVQWTSATECNAGMEIFQINDARPGVILCCACNVETKRLDPRVACHYCMESVTRT